MEASERNINSQPPLLKALAQLLHEIGVYILVGFGLALALLLLFAQLAEDVFANEFSNFDNNFELWLHSQSNPVLDGIFNSFTSIGGLVIIPILTALTFGWLLWQRKFYWAWLVVIGVAGGIIINGLLKAFFHRPRPELWIIRDQLTSDSFPSGHATASFCYFGILAWLGLNTFKRPLLRLGWTLLMFFIIVMVGLSRVYLGAHYPSDVLGAWLSAGVWLAILLNGGIIYNRLHNRAPPKTISEDAT